MIVAKSFMQRGADLAWLSTAPHEQEYLYPPCTFLQPTGRTQRVKLSNEVHIHVLEMTPHIGS